MMVRPEEPAWGPSAAAVLDNRSSAFVQPEFAHPPIATPGPDRGAALARARQDHQACWVLLRGPAEADPAVVRLPESTGWRVLRVTPGTSVAQAWQLLGEAAP